MVFDFVLVCVDCVVFVSFRFDSLSFRYVPFRVGVLWFVLCVVLLSVCVRCVLCLWCRVC